MKRIVPLLTFVLIAFSLAVGQRLPQEAVPENYQLTFAPDLEKATFNGDETISIRVLKPTSQITLNAVDIDFHDVSISSGVTTQKATVTLAKGKRNGGAGSGETTVCRAGQRFTLLTPAF